MVQHNAHDIGEDAQDRNARTLATRTSKTVRKEGIRDMQQGIARPVRRVDARRLELGWVLCEVQRGDARVQLADVDRAACRFGGIGWRTVGVWCALGILGLCIGGRRLVLGRRAGRRHRGRIVRAGRHPIGICLWRTRWPGSRFNSFFCPCLLQCTRHCLVRLDLGRVRGELACIHLVFCNLCLYIAILGRQKRKQRRLRRACMALCAPLWCAHRRPRRSPPLGRRRGHGLCDVEKLALDAMASSLGQRTLVTFVLDVSEPMGTSDGGRSRLDRSTAFASLRVLEMVSRPPHADVAWPCDDQSVPHCIWFRTYVAHLTQEPTTLCAATA